LRTFEVTLISILFAIILGLLTGLGRISRITLVNRIATVYVEVIRGIPSLSSSSISTMPWERS
jgi:polar amino acid transport system permease protein